MKKEILSYINVLHGYTTAIKNLHWSSGSMSEHKLCDDIAETLGDNEDEIAEIAQGIFGKITKNELKPVSYTIETTQKMLSDLLKTTEEFYSKLDGTKFIGLRSVVENFLGEINKYQYLIKFCLKEDLKRKYSSSVNENKQIHLSINQIKDLVMETYQMVNEVYLGDYNYDSFVVIDDSDSALLSTFIVEHSQDNAFNDAVEYAQSEALNNKYGSYSVYGCVDNEYWEDTLVYNTDEDDLNESIVRQVVRESIKGALLEIGETLPSQIKLGALHAIKANHKKKDEGDEIYDYAAKKRDEANPSDALQMIKAYQNGYTSQMKTFKR